MAPLPSISRKDAVRAFQKAGWIKVRIRSNLPRYIKFVREFPMTLLGKVQKFRMREIAIKEYGLE